MKSANFALSVLTFVTTGFGFLSPAQAVADESFYPAAENKTSTGQDSLRSKAACSLNVSALKMDLVRRPYREFTVRSEGLTVPPLLVRGEEARNKMPDRTLSATQVQYVFAFDSNYSLEVTTTRGPNARVVEFSLFKGGAGSVKIALCQSIR